MATREALQKRSVTSGPKVTAASPRGEPAGRARREMCPTSTRGNRGCHTRGGGEAGAGFKVYGEGREGGSRLVLELELLLLPTLPSGPGVGSPATQGGMGGGGAGWCLGEGGGGRGGGQPTVHAACHVGVAVRGIAPERVRDARRGGLFVPQRPRGQPLEVVHRPRAGSREAEEGSTGL